MITVIIPACNEEASIGNVLDNLMNLPIDSIIPVLNGCTDQTLQVIQTHSLASKIALIQYPLPYGIDVPRAVGAACALKMGAQVMLFVDGDLQGDYHDCLALLLHEVSTHRCDLALTNCYPYIGYRSQLAKEVTRHREELNRTLGLLPAIGLATPSHGPHCLSGRLARTVGTSSFAVPPLMLAKAAEAGLKIKVAARLSDKQWQSSQRGDEHNQKIAETIIGDCIEARQYFANQPITRAEHGIAYLGYRTGIFHP